MRRITAACLLFAALASAAAPESENPPVGTAEAEALVARADSFRRFAGSDYSCAMTLVSEKPGREPETFSARLYRRDRTRAACMLLTRPVADKGKGYLSVGDNAWIYDPVDRVFAHISAKAAVEESDMEASDVAGRPLLDLYSVRSARRDALGAHAVVVVELESAGKGAPFARLDLWIAEKGGMALKEEGYGRSGGLLRTVLYPRWEKAAGRIVPATAVYVDAVREGERTRVDSSDHDFSPLADATFTKAFLEGAQ